MKKKSLQTHKLRLQLGKRRNALKQVIPSSMQLLSDNVPRITNETVAAHREDVIGKARKYKYPLQQSKHKIVLVSGILFVAGVIGFFSYCSFALYRLQSSSTFVYRVTQVIPFPVAKAADNRYVSYESYLFELRHYTHYYQNHAKQNFSQQQLDAYKKTALDKVLADAYVKELAQQNKITVSDKEIDEQISIVRSQNRLGDNDKVLEDVLKDYWGWSVSDFRRSLRNELLAQKVASTLDTGAHRQSEAALAELKNGADFATVAAKYSKDASKGSGGDYGPPISRSDRDLPARVTQALFQLKQGTYSGVIDTGYTLEIVKNIDQSNDKVHAAHITVPLKDINFYVNNLKEKQPAKSYLRL